MNNSRFIYSTESGRIFPSCGHPIKKCTCKKRELPRNNRYTLMMELLESEERSRAVREKQSQQFLESLLLIETLSSLLRHRNVNVELVVQ